MAVKIRPEDLRFLSLPGELKVETENNTHNRGASSPLPFDVDNACAKPARDDRGRFAGCEVGGGGGGGTGGGGGGKIEGAAGASVRASAQEMKTARDQAEKKIANAPVPSPAAVAKARAELEKARDGEGRAGGEARGGSAADRRRQRQNLFKEFGGENRGYVVCPWTGLKMHWSDKPEHNPNGYPTFERGKIFVKQQGGGYQLPNLIPESFAANRSRNDTPLRQENLS